MENQQAAAPREPEESLRDFAKSCGFLALLFGVPFLLLVVFLAWPPFDGRRSVPEPSGLVMQVELRETLNPLDTFEILSVDRDGPAIAVIERAGPDSPPRLTVFRFPSGAVLECTPSPSDARSREVRAQGWRAGSIGFDFDGDGVGDELVQGTPSDDHLVQVRSGKTGQVLWSSTDPLEYEPTDRLTALGDLNGDGCAEIAVLHPRGDRSKYDFVLSDMLLGLNSWLSIVSGGLATGAAQTPSRR